MPGLILVLPRDPHTRKTAGGATAAPHGQQPILVQTECALVAASNPAMSSGSGDFRWEPVFPRTPRRPALVCLTELSFSGTRTGAFQGRFAAGRSLAPAAHAPRAMARGLPPEKGLSFSPGRIPSGARESKRKRTNRLCRRRVINEKGNARQCTPAGREPDCHRRERRARRTLHRAQQSREFRGEHL